MILEEKFLFFRKKIVKYGNKYFFLGIAKPFAQGQQKKLHSKCEENAIVFEGIFEKKTPLKHLASLCIINL